MKKKPLKIAIIADALDYQYAGIYYYTKEIINALARIDTFNEYFIIREQATGDISANVKELIIPKGNFLGAAAYRLFMQIPRIVSKKNMDIVLEPRHFGPFNLPKRIKRVTFIHDLSPLHHPEWHQFVSRTLQRIMLPSILRKSDYVLTNSNYTRDDIVKHFPITKNKITTTLLAKESFFKPSTNSQSLEELGITQPYLLHVGTIEPRKNLSLLVNAFNTIKHNFPSPLQLVFVGKKGWKSSSFFEKLDRSPFQSAIKIVGYIARETLIDLYSNAEAFVYPSLFEGFGLPLVEAMACGCPIISSNAACLPEITGPAGLHFSPTSEAQLVKQLQLVLNSPTKQKELRQLSLQQAATFHWDKTARETLAVFEGLV